MPLKFFCFTVPEARAHTIFRHHKLTYLYLCKFSTVRALNSELCVSYLFYGKYFPSEPFNAEIKDIMDECGLNCPCT